MTEETTKINYVGFNKRYDEWLPVDSPCIVNKDAVSDSVLVDPVGAQSDLGQCLSGGSACVAGTGSDLLSGNACNFLSFLFLLRREVALSNSKLFLLLERPLPAKH